MAFVVLPMVRACQQVFHTWALYASMYHSHECMMPPFAQDVETNNATIFALLYVVHQNAQCDRDVLK